MLFPVRHLLILKEMARGLDGLMRSLENESSRTRPPLGSVRSWNSAASIESGEVRVQDWREVRVSCDWLRRALVAIVVERRMESVDGVRVLVESVRRVEDGVGGGMWPSFLFCRVGE